MAGLSRENQTAKAPEGTPTKARPSKIPGSPVKKEDRSKAQDVAELKEYQLGDCLGKGAFGSVYRALNWGTGETVAVKQIKLADLPKSELRVIMLEIDLLKNLDHPNIVKYHGFVKTPEALNIILEFCENGSLHSITNKFGRFPENLVALYMSQVLRGLLYLHEQGVIHRDIKGANILTTKDGVVKLADFGVASKTAGLHDSSVVGTPWWMAPEVIEMTGATTASDIWSLGCTVIELLDGKPPYHNLQPMPALFRIVNDDHPPLPQGASPVVHDFLMQCFQKDPNLRVSAKKLLKHPWILNARRSDQVASKNATEYDKAVKSVQEWNEALKDSPHGNTMRKYSRTSSSSPGPVARDAYKLTKHQSKRTLNSNGSTLPAERFISTEEDSEDNWDNDFTTAISPSALQLPHLRPHDNFGGMLSSEKLKSYASTERAVGQENELTSISNGRDSASQLSESDAYKTVRPTGQTPMKMPERGHTRHKSEMPKPKAKPTQAPRKASLPSARHAPSVSKSKPADSKLLSHAHSQSLTPQIYRESSVEDFSDLVQGNELTIDTKLEMMKMRNQSSSNLLNSPSVTDLIQSMRPPKTGGSLKRPPAKNRISMRRTRSSIEIQRYAEDEDDEDFSDMFTISQKTWSQAIDDGSSPDTLMLSSKISSLSWQDDEEEEDDPFAELEEELTEQDPEMNLAREKDAQLRKKVGELVEELKVLQDDEELLDISNALMMNLSDQFAETKSIIISAHGVLPILEILEDCIRLDVILNLLKIVNAIIFEDEDVQENLCFVGGIPKILKFTSKKCSREIRQEAATFVRQMCQTSNLILQMFVSAGGLSVLVDFLEDDYGDDRELVMIGVNGIWRVFELQGSTPKNDFCRILCRNSVLDPLSIVLSRVLSERTESGEQRELAELWEGRIASIFFIFSQAEKSVLELVAERSVLHRLLKNLRKMSLNHQITMLKFIKNLSMLTTTLEDLHNANAIDVLTELLNDGMNQKHFRELSNQILYTIYNLCHINRRRQEDAALSGIIPILIKIGSQEHTPVKQFALNILCEMVGSGRAARRELWQNKGLNFYVALLSDQNWSTSALEAIFVWLQDETSRVEDQLLANPTFISALIQALGNNKSTSFEKILEPLQKLLRLSPRMSESLAQRSDFIECVKQRLHHNNSLIRLNLLRILGSIFEATGGGIDDDLFSIVRYLQDDPMILVRSMAIDLVRSCDEMDNVSIHSNPGSTTSQSRTVRKPAMIRRQSSNTTPPHLMERQMMPTSPQLSRPSLNYFDTPDRIVQTPRRQRNGVGYVGGSNSARPASREGHGYMRDNSPAHMVPSLARGHTSSAAGDVTVNRSRLPRQSVPGRLSRQSTRESLSAGGLKDSNSSTPLTLTPVAESRRKENVNGSSPQVNHRSRTVEIHGPSARRTTAVRRQNTGGSTPDRDQVA